MTTRATVTLLIALAIACGLVVVATHQGAH
jgi:hypothetical protein